MEICMTTTGAGSPFHRAFSGALVDPTGIDLLVTDRMRTSASEP